MQSSDRGRSSQIEEELFAAIDRLVRGRPMNADLKKKARKAPIRITVATVAKEAGRSRTLIAHKNCAYPRVRQRIMELIKAPKPLFSKETILRLRQEKRHLSAKVEAAEHQAANHYIARLAAERDRDRWKTAYHKLASQGNIVHLVYPPTTFDSDE